MDTTPKLKLKKQLCFVLIIKNNAKLYLYEYNI